jgi:hypothetical protein
MFNIFEEITWPQFNQLPHISKLQINEQVQYYNQYLYQLSEARSNWTTYQNKGPKENFLLQENGSFLLQENGSKIIIT